MSEPVHEHPTRSWSLISSTMIGVTITILAILWSFTPLKGIVVSTYMLMVALVFFVNSTTINEKVAYESKKGSPPEVIDKWVKFAEYSFGLAFTLYISTFSILGYKYIAVNTANSILALFLPIAFLLTTWGIILVYSYIDSNKIIISKKRMLWIGLEAAALICIVLDYFTILDIP